MLRKQTLLFFIFFSTILNAQVDFSNDFTVSNSEPFRVVDAPSKEYFSDMKGFTYSVKTRDKLVIIQKFSIDKMTEVARKEYADFPSYNKSVGMIQLKDRFYYLYESFSKKTDKKSVHAREFITADCTLGKEITLFSSEGTVANGPASEKAGSWGMASGPPFTIFKSFDESKFMIQYRRKPLQKSDAVNYDLLGFFVFDSNLNSIWGKEVKMPFTEKIMNNLAYTVATDGTVYMMAFHRDKKNFQFITIPTEGDISVVGLDHGDFMFKKLYMKENKNGNIEFLGFYANGLDYKFWENNVSFNTNGISRFEISKEGKIIGANEIEFPIELINLYASKKQQKKNNVREEGGKAGIRDLKLREFTVNPDGSVFILGEQYYIVQKYNPSTHSYVIELFYEDLVAMKVNSDGKVVWMKKLPKRQRSVRTRGGNGVAYIKGDSSHYILFLDNVKNANIGISEVPDRHVNGKGGYLTAYKIEDTTGDYSKHTIYNSLQVNGVKTYQFETSRIFDASENTLMVEVYKKGKEDIIIKMEISE